MVPVRVSRLGWVIGSMLLVGGCSASSLTPLRYAVRRIPTSDSMTTRQAARAVLLDRGYRITRDDPVEGLLATKPLEGSARRELSEREVRLSTRSAMRRRVQIRFASTTDTLRIYCQVALQEQDTETHRLLRHGLVTSDLPGRTPIEREAATTVEQNTVWQTIRRDKAAERGMLEAIVQRRGAS